MTSITEEHAEWAVVERLGKMLHSTNEEFKLTETYALFAALLCWILQRLRTKGQSPHDLAARKLFAELEAEDVGERPWSIWTSDEAGPPVPRRIDAVVPFKEFHGLSAAAFLVLLRNAMAHGDATRVRPVNRDNLLVGFEFACRGAVPGQTHFHAKIVLYRSDMRRMGEVLSSRFCTAMRTADSSYFEEAAHALQEMN